MLIADTLRGRKDKDALEKKMKPKTPELTMQGKSSQDKLYSWRPHVEPLIRMTLFCSHHSHSESSAARVAATFQQRPRINTTDLILEMARREERKKEEDRIRKRHSKSFAAWNSRQPLLLPQVSLLAAVL